MKLSNRSRLLESDFNLRYINSFDAFAVRPVLVSITLLEIKPRGSDENVDLTSFLSFSCMLSKGISREKFCFRAAAALGSL